MLSAAKKVTGRLQLGGAVLWFLPVAAELRALLDTLTEVRADRYAARCMGRPALAGAMHKLLTHPRALPLPAAGLARLNVTQARIEALLTDRPVPLRFSNQALLVSSAVTLLACMLLA